MDAGQQAQVGTESEIGTPGFELPGFELTGFTDVVAVASGATSQVFRARQVTMDRLVAIKVLGLTVHDFRVRARFERELAVTGGLSRHPLLITIHSHGITPAGRPYLVMPWYERGSIADEVGRRGRMAVPDVLRAGVKIAAALDHVHGQGIVHRDVKPANVLLSSWGDAVLADFGGAVQFDLISAATTGFTPVHAAPELFCGATASPSSDVWSLTSTLYTALAGGPPFALGVSGAGLVQELAELVQEPMPLLPRSDVPAELVDLLRAGLAKQPADRPTALELATRLQGIQACHGMSVAEIPGAATSWSDVGADLGSQATPGPSMDDVPNQDDDANQDDANQDDGSGRDSERGPAARVVPATPAPLTPGSGFRPTPPPEQATELRARATMRRRPLTPPAEGSRFAPAARLVGGALVGSATAGLVLLGAYIAMQPVGASANSRSTTSTSPAATAPSASATPSASAAAGAAAGPVVAGTPVVVGRGTTTISLTWADSNQGRFRYQVIVAPASGNSSTQRADTTTSHTARSLRPGTTYCFRVATGSARVAPVTAQVCAATFGPND